MKYIIKKNVWVIVWDWLTCQRRWPLVYVLNKFEKKTIFYLLIFFCKSTLLGCFIVRSHTIFNLWHPFLTHSELGINKPIFKGNIYEHVYCIQCFTEVFLIGILVCNIMHWVQSQIQNSQWIHIFFKKTWLVSWFVNHGFGRCLVYSFSEEEFQLLMNMFIHIPVYKYIVIKHCICIQFKLKSACIFQFAAITFCN